MYLSCMYLYVLYVLYCVRCLVLSCIVYFTLIRPPPFGTPPSGNTSFPDVDLQRFRAIEQSIVGQRSAWGVLGGRGPPRSPPVRPWLWSPTQLGYSHSQSQAGIPRQSRFESQLATHSHLTAHDGTPHGRLSVVVEIPVGISASQR